MKILLQEEQKIRGEINIRENHAEKLTAYFVECEKLGLYKKITPEIFEALVLNPEDHIKNTLAERLNKDAGINSIFGNLRFKKKNVFDFFESSEIEAFLSYYNQKVKGKEYEKYLSELTFDSKTKTFFLDEETRKEIRYRYTVTVDGAQEKMLIELEKIVNSLNTIKGLKSYYRPADQIAEITKSLNFHPTDKVWSVDKQAFRHWRT